MPCDGPFEVRGGRSSDAFTERDRQVVRRGRPLLGCGVAVEDLQGLAVAGDGLFEVVGADAAHAVLVGIAEVVYGHRPLAWCRVAREDLERGPEADNGLFEVVSVIPGRPAAEGHA